MHRHHRQRSSGGRLTIVWGCGRRHCLFGLGGRCFGRRNQACGGSWSVDVRRAVCQAMRLSRWRGDRRITRREQRCRRRHSAAGLGRVCRLGRGRRRKVQDVGARLVARPHEPQAGERVPGANAARAAAAARQRRCLAGSRTRGPCALGVAFGGRRLGVGIRPVVSSIVVAGGTAA